MSFAHDQLAHGVNSLLLSQLQSGRADWTTDRLTQNTKYWPGIADWPRPDGAFQDDATNASLAIEFKPAGHAKREYITGLGQAITYLRTFEYAALITPYRSIDNYDIADYLRGTLTDEFANGLPIALFGYESDPTNATDLTPLVRLRPRRGSAPSTPRGIERDQVFWAYWRDLSQYDLYSILREQDQVQTGTFDEAFLRFWDKYMLTNEARLWEGNRRRVVPPQSSYNAQMLNVRLSLRHIQVLDSTGRLTENGHDLLTLGKVYGPSSVTFLNRLAKQILQEGQHLELIFWVDDQQRRMPDASKVSSPNYRRELDRRLQLAGIIPRLPGGEGKQSFLRDEIKLWNKLGLLIRFNRRSYMHPGRGLVFNWRRIIAALD